MRSCEGTGRTIEQAIENALFELKAPREDVDIKILSEGGFLKKAKVLVSISADALPKYEKRDKLRQEEQEETEEESKEKNEANDFVETFINKKIEIAENKNNVQIIADEEYVTASKDEDGTLNVKSEKKEYFDKKVDAKELLENILKALNLTAEISVEEDEKFIRYKLNGDNLNDLIGHHGECMFALSYYLNSVSKNDSRKKIVLDIEDYRTKRAETLTNLAKRVASKVAKSGRYYKFEPMDASERKIIHTALQNDDRVTTMSKGEEPHRYLIVFPREYRED